MDETIKQYLKEHLSIRITDKNYGYNGKYRDFELLIEDEVISSDCISISNDEG